MAVINGKKLSRPRPGKWIVKARDAAGHQIWQEFTTRDDAHDLDNQLRKERTQRLHPTLDRKITLDALTTVFLLVFLQLVNEGIRKMASYTSMKRRLQEHVLPVLGTLRVTHISKQNVRDLATALLKKDALNPYRQKLGRTLTKSGVRSIISDLTSVLSYAVSKGLLHTNPAKNLGVDSGLERTKEEKAGAVELERALDHDEKATFLTVAGEILSPLMYTIFCVLVETGMRIGEVLALRWGDLDLKGRKRKDGQPTIHVQRSINFQDKIEDLPKSNLRRRVDINEDLLPALLAWRGDSIPDPDSLVFHSERSATGHIHYGTVASSFEILCQRARLNRKNRRLTIHSLRHTYAALLATTPGVPLHYISKMLGHSSVLITQRIYAHWLPITCAAAVGAKAGSKIAPQGARRAQA